MLDCDTFIFPPHFNTPFESSLFLSWIKIYPIFETLSSFIFQDGELDA